MLPEIDCGIPKRQGVSVVICCYNSASRIYEPLRYLSKQIVEQNLHWEIILVDNASSDNTQEIARNFWQGAETKVNLKIVYESKPGLSYAREKGINEAGFNIVIFCDDDNLLCDRYIQTAYHIMAENPSIGIAGGWCEAVVENPYAKWMIPFLPALAVGKPASETSYLARKGKCVNGAGMIIRHRFYQHIKEKGFSSLLDDRKQNILSSGGDTELCWAMMYAGYEIYFDELLFFKHVIPPTRLKEEYLLKLTLSSLNPNIILSIYSFIFWNDRAGFTKFVLNDIANRIYSLFYFAPRMVIGKYPFYCSVVFRQNLKILGLFIRNLSKVKENFNNVKSLRQNLIEG
jgi:glycosyltransferase involved in cell wall biosynthesis